MPRELNIKKSDSSNVQINNPQKRVWSGYSGDLNSIGRSMSRPVSSNPTSPTDARVSGTSSYGNGTYQGANGVNRGTNGTNREVNGVNRGTNGMNREVNGANRYTYGDNGFRGRNNNQSDKPTTQSTPPKKSKVGKILLILSAFLLLVGGVLFVWLGIPALEAKDALDKIQETASQMSEDISNKDLSKLDDYFADIDMELSVISSKLETYSFLKDTDMFKGYYANLEILKNIIPEVQTLLDKTLPKAKVILASLGVKSDEIGSDPNSTEEKEKEEEVVDYAKKCGITSSSTSATTSATTTETTEKKDEKDSYSINQLVKVLPDVAELYNEIEPEITKILAEISKIDMNYVPTQLMGGLGDMVSKAKEMAIVFPEISSEIKSTINKLPDLLGAKKPVKYLIVLQNDKEMRASGGLLTAWGNMTVDKGEIVGDIKTTDMWDLENYLSYTLGRTPGFVNIYGQDALMNRGCGATHLRAQDSGIYPDQYVSMDMFTKYYDIANQYNPTKFPGYDHVVTFNTHIITELFEIVEPVVLEDCQVLTADNVAKKIYNETSVNIKDKNNRKSFIGQVGDALLMKVKSLDSDEFITVGETMINSIISKHLAFYSKDKSMQAYFDELGLTGRTVDDFAGDYFQLNEAQNCSYKANFYIYDIVTQNIKIDANGAVKKEINVQWINEKVYDPKEKEILPNSYNFIYRAWIRFMGPKGTQYGGKSVSNMIATPYYIPQTYYSDILEKQVYDDVMRFDNRRSSSNDPIRKASIKISATAPSSVKYNETDGYKLLIQKHPGKRTEKYIININHNGTPVSTEFVLNRDKVLTYKDGKISVEDYSVELDKILDLLEKARE